VKYTGNDIPALGIENGDTLATVELQIVTYITNLATGAGIIPVIDNDDLCALVSGFLPESGDITLNDIISALIQSVCSLKTSVDAINATLTTLNADYAIGCLTGVTTSSDTHDILQAAITKLCATDTALTAFILNVTTNYVTIASLDDRIQEYLDEIAPTDLQKNKMVPYVAYEYYPPGGLLPNFAADGKGFGEFEDVYLCNGNYGTPDRRGRVAAGTTNGTMGNPPLPSSVNPATPGAGNPTYSLAGTAGQNSVILTEQQIPPHTHTATATSTADPHSHFISRAGNSGPNLVGSATLDMQAEGDPSRFSYTLKSTPGVADAGVTNPVTVNVNTSVSLTPTGGGIGHTNVQPTIGAYFIMYIP
jgi:microcystin-dependent protein